MELLFSVTDTGVGIPKEAQQRIFDRFVQADASTSERFGGTGLGLAICRQLVTLMGGTIDVESTPGVGSVFWFTIRCQPDRHAEMPEIVTEVGPSSAPLNILVAEDNAVNQMIIESFLRAQGHAVTMVSNGEEAVTRCAAGQFDVVLMDIYMPRMNGLEATRRLKDLEGVAAATPVLALTASVMPGDREEYRRAGMCGYVAKPIDQSALFAALEAAVAKDETRVGRFMASRWTTGHLSEPRAEDYGDYGARGPTPPSRLRALRGSSR